jgi:hypothetical protein
VQRASDPGRVVARLDRNASVRDPAPPQQSAPRRFRSRLATIRELSSWINTAPLARIYPFGWQGASATVVNMKSPNRFEVGATTGVVQVSRGVLYLESIP